MLTIFPRAVRGDVQEAVCKPDVLRITRCGGGLRTERKQRLNFVERLALKELS